MIRTRDLSLRRISVGEYKHGYAKVAADFVDPVSHPDISERLIHKRYSISHCITRAAEFNNQLVGLIIWEILPKKSELRILNLAYYPNRAEEIVKIFIKEIKRRRSNLWSRIVLRVREKDLDSQLLFSDEINGFRAVNHSPIIADYYGEGQNAIEMEILSESPIYPELPARA